MSHRVDPSMLLEFKRYGAVNIEECFNCGNCTAICPLTRENENFPRKLIRYVQVGMQDELLGSTELWLCYNCGECSETCPRQAEPATFMRAARCYAVTHYDRLGLAKLFCRSPRIGIVFMVLLAGLLALFMYVHRGTMSSESLALFEFVPYEFIHNLGLGAMVFIGLTGLLGVLNMIYQTARTNDLTLRMLISTRMNWLGALWEAIGVEALGQTRYRNECVAVTSEDLPPWYLSKWFVHAATMWGFLGLLGATTLNYILDIVDVKPTGTAVPIWYPVRLLGTFAGLLFVYGVSVLIVRRFQKNDKAHSYSYASDWTFLVLLWISGVSGFMLELALYLPHAPLWGYWLFLFHVAVSMELVLLLPFTKFAHAIYRTVALYIRALKPVPETEVQLAEATS